MNQPIINSVQRNIIRQRARQIKQHFQALQTASWQGQDLMSHLERINQFEAKLYEYAAQVGVHVAPNDQWNTISVRSLDTGDSVTIPVM